MKKIFILMIFGNLLAYSQAGESFLPNMNPPSPEAYAISEYGKNGVTESSGKLNLSIPIYNFTSGQLSLPISLNYSGAGVKVNDIATWTGINWNLVAGGVISRRVNDFADEGNRARKFINLNHLLENATDLCAPFSQEYIDMANMADAIDTEVDVFNFSFNGFSGSFYLDQNFNPIYIENEHEIKIELYGSQTTNLEKLRQSKTFIITTPDGIKYYFGGAETEFTRMLSGNIHNTVDANTGFYLFKIVHPNNGQIYFSYKENVTSKIVDLHKVYSCPASTNNGSILYVEPYTALLLKSIIVNPRVLSKITSSETSIVVNFNSTQYVNNHFVSTLDNIEVKNNFTVLKSAYFTYGAKIKEEQINNDFTTASRFFLEKIEIDKNIDLIGDKFQVYSMEYNKPYNLPERLSNSQDLLGYYNGKDNETLIASPPDYTVLYHSFLANRYPEFSLASLGTLTKITYPTKGFSKFEYEPSVANEKKITTYAIEAGLNGVSHLPTLPGEYDFFSNQNVVFPAVYTDQTCVLKITTGVGGATGYIPHGYMAKLTITDVTPNLTPQPLPTIISQNFAQEDGGVFLYNFNFIKNHIYTFELKVVGGSSGSQTNNLRYAKLEFEIDEGFNEIESFSVRIKRQSDFSEENLGTNLKRYYYKNITLDINFPIPEILHMPRSSYEWYTGFPEGVNSLRSIIHSEPANRYFNASNGEFYDVVSISYGGDNFELGGTEKYFIYNVDISIEKLPLYSDGCWLGYLGSTGSGGLGETPNLVCGVPAFDPLKAKHFLYQAYKTTETTDISFFNGRLIGERNYKKINNQLFKINEKIYNYGMNENLAKQATNFIGKNIFGEFNELNFCEFPIVTQRQSLMNFYMAYYHVNCYNFKLNKIITKEYIDPVPLNVYQPMYDSELGIIVPAVTDINVLEASYNKITTSQVYTYGLLRGLPTEITTTTSDSGIINKTVNTYVNTANSLSSIPTNQSNFYASLLAANRVEIPVQTQQYKNTELLSTQRTLYNNFTGYNTTKILPEKIQISKGDLTTNPLEDKAIFYNYDYKFNPAVIGYKNALKTKYIYNMDGLVVAKIENYTGTSTDFPVLKENFENPCDLHAEYPTALVTVFQYDLITKKLIQITDPNCRNTFYKYDDLHRLKFIKDHDGNIVKEYDQHFKPQN